MIGRVVVESSYRYVCSCQEKRRAELVHSLLAMYHHGARCRVYERFLEEPLLPMAGVQQLLEVLRKVNFEENLRPTVHASGVSGAELRSKPK